MRKVYLVLSSNDGPVIFSDANRALEYALSNVGEDPHYLQSNKVGDYKYAPSLIELKRVVLEEWFVTIYGDNGEATVYKERVN